MRSTAFGPGLRSIGKRLSSVTELFCMNLLLYINFAFRAIRDYCCCCCLHAVGKSLGGDAGHGAHKIQNMVRKEICHKNLQLTLNRRRSEESHFVTDDRFEGNGRKKNPHAWCLNQRSWIVPLSRALAALGCSRIEVWAGRFSMENEYCFVNIWTSAIQVLRSSK